MEIFEIILFIGFLAFTLFLYLRARRSRQLSFVESYDFHPVLAKKVKQTYPHLKDEQVDLVFRGLRDYFKLCLQAKKRAVAMPSRVVDAAWHEFIVFTRAYAEFSKMALGRYLHHTPTEAMQSPTTAQDGIKRAWRLACANESIDPKIPSRLPLLFALDKQLEIKNGFHYSRNCKRDTTGRIAGDYCASHIGCSSGCAGSSGSADESSGFSDWFGGGDCSSCGGD